MDRRLFLKLSTLVAASAALPDLPPPPPKVASALARAGFPPIYAPSLPRTMIYTVRETFHAKESGVVTLVTPKPFLLERVILASNREGFLLKRFMVAGAPPMFADDVELHSDLFSHLGVDLGAVRQVLETELAVIVENLADCEQECFFMLAGTELSDPDALARR